MSGRVHLLMTVVAINVLETPATPSKQGAFYTSHLLNKTSLAKTIEELIISSISKETKNSTLQMDQTPKIVSLIVIGINVLIGFFYRALLIENVLKSGLGGLPPISIMTGEF